MTDYKISMIIPTYNIGTDLNRSINSLFNQTIGFKNIEVILVDDYSTDNTRNIILDFANKYDNIKYIFLEKNSGSAGKPRNVGIKNASADYIMFLDNDDEYVKEACELLYAKINETDANLIVSSKINNFYKPTDKEPQITEPPEFKEINILNDPDFLFHHTEFAGAMWSKIFKKEFLLNNNIECLEKLPEDTYFMHTCYYLNPKVLFLTNLRLYNHYFYRGTGKSITVTLSSSFLEKSLFVYTKLKDLNQKHENTSKFFDRYNKLYFGELAYFIIICEASKKEKTSLIQKYIEIKPKTNFKLNDVILNSWYRIVCTNKMNLILAYTNILNFLIKIKRKIIN